MLHGDFTPRGRAEGALSPRIWHCIRWRVKGEGKFITNSLPGNRGGKAHRPLRTLSSVATESCSVKLAILDFAGASLSKRVLVHLSGENELDLH